MHVSQPNQGKQNIKIAIYLRYPKSGEKEALLKYKASRRK